EAVQLQEAKVKSTEKGYLPNTGSQSDQATITTGLALLGLGAGLAARKRRKED
ncbi:LPXTG cell wall anchor domain-containing protein, partial [Lachnoclostridium sp. 210928-DFI.6.3]|nr:LPXTG cell wall anchor domain-containing protein [Lachnoclostridium sp. 210928-DFI.6.3]